jgi:hypothetical protein
MRGRATSLFSVGAVLVALGPLVPAHAVETSETAVQVVVPAADVGTTAIRFRESWLPDPQQAMPGPVVGSFEADQVPFMALEVNDGNRYDVTAFDGQQSGEVELTVPDTLAPGTYDTSAMVDGTDQSDARFFFHGHLGYAGYGTGSFTVVRSSYDADGQIASFLATYDEVLDDVLGDSHVVGVVSWSDPGDVPAVVSVAADVALLPGGHARLHGVVLSTGTDAQTLAPQRISHGMTTALEPVPVGANEEFVITDRPPCAGGAVYVVSVSSSAAVIGDSAVLSVPLVRCPTHAGLPGPSLTSKHRAKQRR